MPGAGLARLAARAAVVAVAAALVGVVAPVSPAAASCGLTLLDATKTVNLQVGGGVERLVVTMRANCATDDLYFARVDIPMTGEGVEATGGSKGCDVTGDTVLCRIDGAQDGDTEIYVELSPPRTGGPATGKSRKDSGQVSLAWGSPPGEETAGDCGNVRCENDPETEAFDLSLSGSSEVAEVSGTVLDSGTSEPVGNAAVRVVDGASREHKTTTDQAGEFQFRAGGKYPVAPGRIRITALKDGYQIAEHSATVKPGKQIAGVRLALRPEEAPASSGPPAAAPPATGDAGSNLWLYLILLGVTGLVAAGVGFVVHYRRRAQGGVVGSPGTVPLPVAAGPTGEAPTASSTLIDIHRGSGATALDGYAGRHSRPE